MGKLHRKNFLLMSSIFFFRIMRNLLYMEQNVHRIVREKLQTQQDPTDNVNDFPFVLNDTG